MRSVKRSSLYLRRGVHGGAGVVETFSVMIFNDFEPIATLACFGKTAVLT